jgi:hypothetical protein
VLFTSQYSGWELFKYKASKYLNVVINWFVNNL